MGWEGTGWDGMGRDGKEAGRLHACRAAGTGALCVGISNSKGGLWSYDRGGWDVINGFERL